jgi:hypothetical protein
VFFRLFSNINDIEALNGRVWIISKVGLYKSLDHKYVLDYDLKLFATSKMLKIVCH